MANIAADIDAKVTPERSWVGVERFGGAEDFPACQHDVCTLPDHAADWARCGVVDQRWEEWFLGEVGIMLFKHRFAWLAKLHGDELESLLLELLDDASDEVPLHAIRLDHDVRSLFCWGGSGRLTFLILLLAAFLSLLLFLLLASFLAFLAGLLLGGFLRGDLFLGEEDLVSRVEVNCRL